MTAHKVSVAIGTYNGSAYLAQQLQSIVTQTRSPDELIICDDGSTDATPRQLEQFSRSTAIPTHIVLNRRNLGTARNFEQAISLCSGDLVFLADQDDVWLPDKIERIVPLFDGAGCPVMVFTDAHVVDSGLRSLGYCLWDSMGFSASERRRFQTGRATEVLVKHNVVTGATLAFRRPACKLILPIDARWVHDAWIALLLSASGNCAFLDQPLIYYRQHPQQQIGGVHRTFAQRIANSSRLVAGSYQNVADQYLAARQRLLSATPRTKASDAAIQLITDKAHHFTVRARLLDGQTSRFGTVVREWLSGRYSKYSLGMRSAARDMLLARAGRRT